MQIVLKVKNIHDFGKKKLKGNMYEYEHDFPRINKGDFLIYFYPENNAIGVYKAIKETEYYLKDGFQNCKGIMERFELSAIEFIEWVKKNISIELSETFDYEFNQLLKGIYD